MAILLDGRVLSKNIKNDLAEKVSKLKHSGNRAPQLAVILVGADPASLIYVGRKEKAALECFFESKTVNLPEDSSFEDIKSAIEALNNDDNVDGILLQLPLPKSLKEHEKDLLNLIDPVKDIDGLHPINVGKLSLGEDAPIACTANGIIKLLKYNNIDIDGKHAVIIGRSNIVGKPLIQLLLRENATVTVCHSHTENLSEFTKSADILIVAIGKANYITADMVKENACIVDVGINRLGGRKITGDVDFTSVEPKVNAITPVPGGVGPMTIAMLLENTLICYLKRKNIK